MGTPELGFKFSIAIGNLCLIKHGSLPLWLSVLTCEIRFGLEGLQGHFQFHNILTITLRDIEEHVLIF